MPVYAVWNNKGGVGKSYLTFQMACEYARIHRDQQVLVLDLCPQANVSSMLLGGIIHGEAHLEQVSSANPKLTISGYIEQRISSPYTNPKVGARYVMQPNNVHKPIPTNLHLVIGDEELEVQASRVSNATRPGPSDAWRIVHTWITDLISDIRAAWNVSDGVVFIDCNPSFTIYTELAMSAADRLIIPFSADGSSKRAVRAVLSLLYGITRVRGAQQSEFYLNSNTYRMATPKIFCYVGNRLTTANYASAAAFKMVVNEIGKEIWSVWRSSPNVFAVHPAGQPSPTNAADFRKMFQADIRDANTASVVSGSLGIPISYLAAGSKTLMGKRVTVNQSQLDQQKPNLRRFVQTIE